MTADLLGYYRMLELTPSASAVQIKAAYRNLAKAYHPDSGNVDDGGARFRKLGEAYAVLGDPNRRASYDGASAMPDRPPSSGQAKQIDPLRCRDCGQITAQPRYLIFWRVVSFVLATQRTPIQGVYCSPCASKEASKSTVLTVLFGWWGFPWGPIWTIVEGFKNAIGGTRDESRDEILLWHNALSFGSSGNLPLAYGLCERLLSAKSREIQTGAAELIDLFRSQGFVPAGRLRDPWAARRVARFYRMIAIGVVPMMVGVAIFASSSGSPSNTLMSPAPAYAPYSPPPTVDALVATQPSNAADARATAVAQEPTCKTLPVNGKVLSGTSHLNPKGHVVTIQNGSGGDAIVKVRNAATNRLVASFFVANNSQADLRGLRDGTYRIQYAFGDRLAKDCKSFVGLPSAGEFPDVERFTTTEASDALGVMVRRMHMSYTLYAVPSGNVQPTTIDAASFNQP